MQGLDRVGASAFRLLGFGVKGFHLGRDRFGLDTSDYMCL